MGKDHEGSSCACMAKLRLSTLDEVWQKARLCSCKDKVISAMHAQPGVWLPHTRVECRASCCVRAHALHHPQHCASAAEVSQTAVCDELNCGSMLHSITSVPLEAQQHAYCDQLLRPGRQVIGAASSWPHRGQPVHDDIARCSSCQLQT